MRLRRSSRDVQFISTSPPEERTFLLKKLEKLKALPDNSHDKESDNMIKRYQRRPNWKICVRQQLHFLVTLFQKLISKAIFKIIRSVRYHKDDQENYFREQLILCIALYGFDKPL